LGPGPAAHWVSRFDLVVRAKVEHADTALQSDLVELIATVVVDRTKAESRLADRPTDDAGSHHFTPIEELRLHKRKIMAKKKPLQGKTVSKTQKAAGKARTAATRVKLSGKTTRVKGHTSARTRRSQAKRDAKNP
jgi:hypothetical protein